MHFMMSRGIYQGIQLVAAPKSIALVDSINATAWTGPTAAICTIVNREDQIHEFIDYHLGIGFHHIYLYDNSPDNELRKLNRDNVTVTHFPGIGMSPQAQWNCAQRYGLSKNHTWIAIFDADEFLALYRHSNVIDFLMEHCPSGALSVNWRMMSSSNRSAYSPLPTLKRFQGIANEVNIHVKSIVFLKDMDLG
jgi:hypothetical protein